MGINTMRASQYFLPTLKETPSDAEIISHRLMLRAGLIRKLTTGIYTWLPLGLRVIQKVSSIVREEMNRAGAIECLMPIVQPGQLWETTGRWDQYGKELLKFQDRHERASCLGPTHEEVITDLIQSEISSYKQLPLNLYQINTKFRDEIRPRFGVMRAREFVMKDAYSFDLDQASMEASYQRMYDAYCTIFERLGLDYRAVLADTGSIGGSASHEFQVLADAGEDVIAFSDTSDYAANIELAEALMPAASTETPEALETIDTPGLYTIETLCDAHEFDVKHSVKTLIVEGENDNLIALVLRGDHELNALKAEKLNGVKSPLTFAAEADIVKAIGAKPGSLGPVNLKLRTIVDRAASVIVNFVCGANLDDKHLVNANWERDAPLNTVEDLRFVVPGDVSPDGKGQLQFKRGIEVGHVFQLGDKYSTAMKAFVQDEKGKAANLQMGCYGIGITRIVAAAIEQHHDDRGILWPAAMAPFKVGIIPMQYLKSPRVKELTDTIYEKLTNAGIDVLLDDRKERPGVMFANMDLIGLPTQIIIGERNLDEGVVEVKRRGDEEAQLVKIEDVLAKVV